MKIPNLKLKIIFGSPHFRLGILLTAILVAVILPLFKPPHKPTPPEKRYSASLKDVHNLPIQGPKIVKIEDKKSNFQFEYNFAGQAQASFGKNEKKNPTYEIKENNSSLSFSLQNQTSEPKVTDNTLEYETVVENIPMKMKLTTSENKIKEEFIINEKPKNQIPKTLSIPFSFDVSNLTHEVTKDGIVFTSKDKKTKWTIPNPTLVDAKGKQGKITHEISQNTYYLILDTKYLETASYPVVIDPTVVINTSSDTGSSGPSTMRHLARTSDGTLHSFIQIGTQTATCAVGGSKSGLLWFNSTDSGATWNCQEQLSSDTTNLMYADARVDTSDNIYVVYSVATTGASASYDVFYRKLTKGVGATWTLEAAQTVLNGDGAGDDAGFSYATIELEGTTRAWIAVREYDGTNYQVGVYYSDGLTTAPTWTVSQATLDTAGNSASYHYPTIVRFGSKIGVIYNDQTLTTVYWRYRSDSDGLTTWSTAIQVESNTQTTPTFSAIGTTLGKIFLSINNSTFILGRYFNGNTWSNQFSPTTSASNNAFTSVSTDGTNAWFFYGETTGLNSSLSGSRKLVYKKCVPPFSASDCDTNSTPVASYQGLFDKYWSFVSSAYTDDTTDAGDVGTNDVQIVSSNTNGDIAYFGKTEKFDSLSWDLTVNGVGGTLTWEYCSAVDATPACTTWSALTLTAFNSPQMTTDGWAAFTAPSDWEAAKVNGEGTAYYYIRARAATNYSTSPVGAQIASIPQINWASALPNVSSNTIPLAWTENASSPMKTRYAGISATASSAPATTAEITTTVAYSSSANGTQPSTMRHIVRTSDGTLHAFVQAGTTQGCGGAVGNNNVGLVWINSTDSGATWTCQGQLSSDTTNQMNPDARVDSSDNIYVVYSMATTGASASYDVFYRKLTKGEGATWTLEAAQTVLNGDGAGDDAGFSYATIELEGTTRAWIAVREYDGTNYQVGVYYSDGLTTAPTWTVSQATLDTAGSTTQYHYPTIVRFGTKIGVIYNDQATSGDVYWRYRDDADGLTTWTSSTLISTSPTLQVPTFSAAASGGRIYLTINDSLQGVDLYTYNGTSWTRTSVATSSTAAMSTFSSVSTDGTNAWVFYGQTTGLSTSLSGPRKLVYKKCTPPFTSSDCDTNATPVVSYHGVFDKLWSYTSTTSAYLDQTTPAGNTTSSDTQMVGAIDDVLYFGKTEKFDSISWDLSRVGTSGVVMWEYWNGSTWMALTDFNVVSNQNFTADGYLSFTPHTDWSTTTINGEGTAYYYVRARVTTNYGISPFGLQLAAIPLVNWTSPLPNTVSNTSPLIWIENAAGTAKIRYSGTSVTASSAPSAASEINPKTVGYSSGTTASQPSTMRHIVRTSDGTLHAFVQGGSQRVCGGAGGDNNNGLMWINSTDNGATWTCQGQLSPDPLSSPPQISADARVDSSDNIYVLYSRVNAGAFGTTYDVWYRKFTYNGSSSWTMESEQTALDSTSATTGYFTASLELEGTTRIWLATRRYDGANYQVSVYYSDGFSTSPSWTQSIATLNTAGTQNNRHWPLLVRFGSKIGVLYVDNNTDLNWRYRADSDDLTSWVAAGSAIESNPSIVSGTFSAVGDSNGKVYLTYLNNAGTSVIFNYWNGSVWSSDATVSSGTLSSFVSTATNGTNVWVFYGQTTGLSSSLSGSGKLVYKRGTFPFATANFDTTATPVVPYHDTFKKFWSYTSTTSAYLNQTTPAGNTTSADTQMLGASNDAIYFGSANKFDSISWDLSRNGTTGVVAWEYWNGSTWTSLTDFRATSNSTFTADGYLAFVPNTDWATTKVNTDTDPLYYVRARVTTNYGIAPFGVQFAAIPQINWASATPLAFGSKIGLIWTENAAATTRIRYAPISLSKVSLLRGVTLRRGVKISRTP